MNHSRPVLALAVLSLFAGGACLPASNPCDPDAPADVQREGTSISGRVTDQTGAGVEGVVVSIAGQAETAISGDDGAFIFESLLPAPSYALRAEPQAPLVGGTTQAGALACREQKIDVEVRVVRPLDAPEAELVRAVSPTSLIVAFGAPSDVDDGGGAEAPVSGSEAIYAGDDNSYRQADDVAADCTSRAQTASRTFRLQVRAPFDVWQDAVIGTFPWMEGDTAVALNGNPGEGAFGDALLTERLDDVCAAAMCAQFAYLEPTLADPRARCATVVGRVEDGVAVPLDAYGSYEVRVLADVAVDPALQATFGLPAQVSSQASTRARQMSLVPGALLPVVDATGAPVVGRGADVFSVVAVAGGRFALVENDTVQVVGGGADVFAEVEDASVTGGPQDALATDAVTQTNLANDFSGGGTDPTARATAALPAGDWLRIVKEGASNAAIEKLYVGASSAAGRSGPALEEIQARAAAEAQLPMRPAATPLGTLRAVSYLEPGSLPLTSVGANPRDAYVLLYERGFILVENATPGEHALAHFIGAANANGGFNTAWGNAADNAAGVPTASGFAGRCTEAQSINEADTVFGASDGVDDLNGQARTDLAVCFDLSAATGDVVDLRDVEPFAGGSLHIIADAKNDRLLVAPHDSILGVGGRPFVGDVTALPVGREPTAMTRSRLLDCSAAAAHREVLLVANAGSADISVVGEAGGAIDELAVLELSTSPTGFVEDADRPSCDDPFAWVIGADGRVTPIDMRGAAAVPRCDDDACAIGSRGRARSGAIGRSGGRGRAVVGGASLVGELGFFRPAALRGAAFEQF